MPACPVVDGGERRPALGYGLAAAAAAMWAVNGSLARFLLDDGVSAAHLSQIRATASALILVAALAVTSRRSLVIHRRDLPAMVWLGVAGLAGVHATYFLAIERLEIGVALTVQYLGPMLILVWLALAHRRRLRRSLWGAVALAVAGCALVVEVQRAGALDGLGLLAAAGAAITFAVYMVAAERAGRRYPAMTTLAWAFTFAALFWLVVRPPWTFPVDRLGDARAIALAAGVVLVGTLVPFVLMLTAVRHVPASRAGVVATLEPVLAALIAWPVHGEALAGPQILGGLLVVVAVVWVQTHPPLEQESAPDRKESRRGGRAPMTGVSIRLPKRQTVREDGTQRHGAP
jgi:drug/metabolite transporter (DMT)-like permease